MLGWGLTGKEHRGTFRGDGSVLYLDRDVGCMGGCIGQIVNLRAVLFNVWKLYLNFMKEIKLRGKKLQSNMYNSILPVIQDKRS